MTDEKLRALRSLVEGYYTEFDVGMNTYTTQAVGKTLLELIDAEQQRRKQLKEQLPCGYCSSEYHQTISSFCTRYHTSDRETSTKIETRFCPNCGCRLDD